MTPLPECVHEREVLDLVLADRWPDRCDEEIRTHAAGCDVCRDVLAVAMAMRDADLAAAAVARRRPDVGDPLASGVEEGTARQQHPLPDATLVWWRAQLRAHEDAGRRAARPIAMAQGIGLGLGLVAAVSVSRMFWPSIRAAAGASASVMASALQRVADSSSAAAAAAPWLAFGLIVSVIVTPVALYFALGRD